MIYVAAAGFFLAGFLLGWLAKVYDNLGGNW